MTFLAVPLFVDAAEAIDDCLERARQSVARGARLIEWRIDALADDADAARHVEHLVRNAPAPCIVTCRPTSEGGLYDGDDTDRISLLEHLATGEHRPRYLDVELATYTRSENLRQKVNLAVAHAKQARDLDTSLILSSHDFNGRPADLLQRIESMTKEPACAVVKIAWLARSLRDNLEAFDLLAERHKPTIALCMGRFGLMSRVLAPKFGGLLTFAADRPAAGTAPGQPTLDDLNRLYRFAKIGRDTKVYGVIGWPAEHSRGPLLHNAAFDAVGHDGVYLPLPIPPEWEHFNATVGAMVDHPRLDFRGASVTLPHKEHLLRFVRERGGVIDPLVDAIGAANTLVVDDDGTLHALNTDAPAAIEALCNGMNTRPADLAGTRAAVVGAGGAARAIVAGLVAHGVKVVVFNRSRDRAEALAADFHGRQFGNAPAAHVVVGEHDALGCGCFPIMINATSIGMADGPAPDENPFEAFTGGDDVPLDDSVTVFDTVYTPERTPLIREAEARGARVITGGGMFLRQAALQFHRWTGKDAPTEKWRHLLQ